MGSCLLTKRRVGNAHLKNNDLKKEFMSNLTRNEKQILEKFFKMNDGEVLDFSHRTLQEFILDHTEINVNDDLYNNYYQSGSKANRLRTFWEIQPNHTVAKLIDAFLRHWETQKLIHNSEISESENQLLHKCNEIVERLKEEDDTIETLFSMDAHFDNIQQQIIDQIKLARFTIWVAVAWFTDKKLFQHLVTKSQQGVNVQSIIIDDKINQKSGLNYEQSFETYRISKSGGYENIMHNKFCIIDIETVIHGSYNWTNKAQSNDETINIIKKP